MRKTPDTGAADAANLRRTPSPLYNKDNTTNNIKKNQSIERPTNLPAQSAWNRWNACLSTQRRASANTKKTRSRQAQKTLQQTPTDKPQRRSTATTEKK